MRRIILIIIAILSLSIVAQASAAPTVMTFHGQELPCPDPSGYQFRGQTYIACTSDFAPNVFGIFRTKDGQHFQFVTHVFPAGHHPWWTGNRFWAPDLTRIGGKWVVYFAAFNNTIGRFSVGVAWNRHNNMRGHWHDHRVHFAGQLNNTSAEQEPITGAIDPGEADFRGHRYLVWSDQAWNIWIAPLTSDGMNIAGTQVHKALQYDIEHDCDNNGCVVEGSALIFHGGDAEILYSVKSTWDGSYSERYATAPAGNPMGQWTTYPNYILQPGGGWYNTGGGQTPVKIGNHLRYFFHATKLANDAAHASAVRIGMSVPFSWQGHTPVLGSLS